MKIKKGDMVIVRTGKDRGVKAKVISALPKEEKVVVEGVNLQISWKKDAQGVSHHAKEAKPIHVSNVGIVDPKSGKATRISIKRENGKRTRLAQKSGQVIG